MKAVAWTMGTLMMIVGGYQLGQIMESPSTPAEPVFSYEEASVEDKTNWLSEHSAPMERRVQRVLGTNNPTLSHLSYKETKILTAKREVQYIAKMSRIATGNVPHGFTNTLKERLCPSYVKSELSKKNIGLTVRVVRDSGAQAFATTIRPSQCQRYAQVSKG